MSKYIHIFFFSGGGGGGRGGAQKNRLFVTVLLSTHCGCCYHKSKHLYWVLKDVSMRRFF